MNTISTKPDGYQKALELRVFHVDPREQLHWFGKSTILRRHCKYFGHIMKDQSK